MKMLTVVIPAFNEAEALGGTLDALLAVLDGLTDVETAVLVVDDGSTDRTATLVAQAAARDPRVGLLRLGRHSGKEGAIHAGLANAPGDAVLVMDADLQHPPELVPEMVRLWRGGLPVVEAVKRSRGAEAWPSRLAARLFYRLLGALSELDLRDRTDFKLLDREVVAAVLALPERRRFFRGLVNWLGFPSATIPFDVPARPRGRRRFTSLARLRLSVTAITSFSSAPLQLITLLGAISCLLGLVIGGIALRDTLTGHAIGGFPTVILLILILGGLIMVGLGLLGVYLAHIFEEVKARPLYRVDRAGSFGPGGRPQPPGAPREKDTRTVRSAPADAGSSTSGGETVSTPDADR